MKKELKVGHRVSVTGKTLLSSGGEVIKCRGTIILSGEATFRVQFDNGAQLSFMKDGTYVKRLVKKKMDPFKQAAQHGSGFIKIEREPREYWINIYPKSDGKSVVHNSKKQADKNASGRRKECIKVREVIE